MKTIKQEKINSHSFPTYSGAYSVHIRPAFFCLCMMLSFYLTSCSPLMFPSPPYKPPPGTPFGYIEFQHYVPEGQDLLIIKPLQAASKKECHSIGGKWKPANNLINYCPNCWRDIKRIKYTKKKKTQQIRIPEKAGKHTFQVWTSVRVMEEFQVDVSEGLITPVTIGGIVQVESYRPGRLRKRREIWDTAHRDVPKGMQDYTLYYEETYWAVDVSIGKPYRGNGRQ